MRDRNDDRDERDRGEFSGGPRPWRGELGGDYARDPHYGGYGADYARDGGWSGAGRADDYTRDAHWGGSDRAYSESEMPRRQSFRGKGPKNWRRSDERLRDEVCELLTDDHDVDATDVDVQVKEGEVTLAGNVGSRWEKRLAEDIAASCSGVRDVHNRLTISDRESQLGKASE